MRKKVVFGLIKIVLLSLLLVACCKLPQPRLKTVDVLFVAYDRGESNAFIQLEKQLRQKNISYKVLAIGSAADIFINHSESIKLPFFNLAEKLRHERSLYLPADIIASVIQSYSPRIVYSGMASVAQAQLVNSFRRQGSYGIAFYDNFDNPLQQQYLLPFLKEIASLDELHVPTASARKGFLHLLDTKSADIIVTGQPALEEWDDVYRQTDDGKVRQRLGLSANEPVILFAGGYDHGYEESFKIFVQGANRLKKIQFFVTHHPKYDGKLEDQIIKKYHCNNVQLIVKNQATTAELSKIASVIVTHKSTVGVLALYKNKPVVYVAGSHYSNFLLEAGLALKASTPEQVSAALMTSLSAQKPLRSLKDLGVPSFPAQEITSRLYQQLQKAQTGGKFVGFVN